MTRADASAAPNWSFRADEAARSVTRLFGQRLFFLPGTHIGAILRPSGRLKNLSRPWHYWWQAHYLDCLVDAGRRELGSPGHPGTKFDGENRPSAGRLASRLVTGIRLRNFLTVVNNYYDDMAWLALATLRLDELAEDTRKPTGRERNAKVLQSLTLQFDSASTDDLGGGTVLEHQARLQKHPRHRTGGPLLRTDGQPGQGAGAARLAGCPSLRAGTGPVPGRPADFRRGRRGAGRDHLHLQPGARSSAPCWNSAATRTSDGRPRWWTP